MSILADIEMDCREWEDILFQVGGKTEVEAVIKANEIITPQDTSNLKDLYIAAIARHNLYDACPCGRHGDLGATDEGSTTAGDDSGSMEIDAGAVVNARNVTGSVAIS
ncbi:hypothetical protein L210DRAFT_3507260 [Boletus edulis BED1]|uniref:Uncharacterized protein n=1 Tax=Boletus edulis BED1 TaxID=1328754 RepID=A0AAD4G9R7_BOLED|nr:hypothetical protein L210DRAFT_3507260 [Boletus edulis BED1]